MNFNYAKSMGFAHSAISVVNALASGKGVTIGIDIPCKVSAEFISQKIGDNFSKIKIIGISSDPHELVNRSASYSLKSVGAKLSHSEGIRLKIDSLVPVAVGLKSSSAVSAAVVSAVLGLFTKDTETNKILRISSIASKDSGASLTGAFDDAGACFLGGMVFADNLKFKLLKHQRVPNDLGEIVKLLIPLRKRKLTSSIDRSIYVKQKDESMEAFRYALDGVVAQAMLLNSIIQCLVLRYSLRPVVSALHEGASASGISGKGPAVAALCRSSKIASRVSSRWVEENPNCKVISSRIVQPTVVRTD
ncbi:MAG: shikimate kinase [Thaumarchaeota archaeon]|nr:shikimate kinase [Nitrososphaerota archaeon]